MAKRINPSDLHKLKRSILKQARGKLLRLTSPPPLKIGDIAEKLGVSRGYIYDFRSGNKTISDELAVRLIEFLDKYENDNEGKMVGLDELKNLMDK